MIADEKTGIYERKLIRKLLQADQQTNSAYRRLISDVAPILAQYRSSSRGVIINDPDLNRQLSSQIAIFRKRIEEMISTNQSWAWALADDKNDQIINEYISNLPISNVAREGLFARNNQAFDNFQKRKYDGLQLSDRVWSLGKQNEDLLQDYLDNALITGRTADDLSRDVRELLTEPNRLFRRVRNPKTGKLELSKAAQAYHPGRGMYRSSYMNAKRLARTEINMAYRTSDQERWKTLKFVLGYEVKLSNRHPAPDICDHAAGRYPKEFKFVGWHPQCLCYAVPILPNKKSFLDNLIDDVPLKGKVTDIPDSMKQYISDNLSRIAAYGKQPFWVQDNFKGGRIDGGIMMKAPTVNSIPVTITEAIPTAIPQTGFIPAKTIEDANRWAKDNLGVEYDSTSILNLEARNEINKAYLELKKEYPNTLQYFGETKLNIAESSKLRMNFNPEYFNNIDEFKKIDEIFNKSKSNVSKLDVNPIKTTVTHEYAHSLTNNDLKFNINSSKQLKYIHKRYKDAILNYEYTYRKSAKEYEHYISFYANKDVWEFVAEAFTQYKLYGEKSSKFAKAVGTIIDKYYKK